MTKSPGKSVIDFTNNITERTNDFTGREWVFQAINNWLTDTDGPRFFLLTGEPGSGKTAIASRLAQFSQGTVAPPAGLRDLTPGFLSAIHFCSAHDSRRIDPYVFAESLAIQLAERYPYYAQVLLEKSGERQIVIEANQNIQYVVSGQVRNIVINSLNISGIAPEDAFNRIVREPVPAT
jgi:hypothetical protein